MRIAILGTGTVGASLARAVAAAGHDVTLGTRDPSSEQVRALLDELPDGTRAVATAAAPRGADVVVLAVPYGALAELVPELPLPPGQVVVDATNPLRREPDGPVHASSTSAAEEVAALAPDVRVVKAFNTIGAEHYGDPTRSGVTATLPVASDDDAARWNVMSIATDLGFDAVDAGPLRNARALEHLAVLWVHLASVGGLGRDIAWHLAGREGPGALPR
jgi:NADPH-dependent F420 reductase